MLSAPVVFVMCILVSRFTFDRVDGVDIIMAIMVAVMSVFMLPINTPLVMASVVLSVMCIGVLGGTLGYYARKRFPILKVNYWGKGQK